MPMQRLEGLMRKAMQMYQMLQNGDKICVGVSGGKDSIALAIALKRLSRYYEKNYELCALSIDPCFNNAETDFSSITSLFETHGIEHHIKRSNIGPLIFDKRAEKNPCALCAKMRRGLIHRTAKQLGCNKVALGHHADDAVETFLMNLFTHGQIDCFSPVTWLSESEITLIRPMLLARESEVARAAAAYPLVKSRCPVDGITLRSQTKQQLAEYAKTDPAIYSKLVGAMQNANVGGWQPFSE